MIKKDVYIIWILIKKYLKQENKVLNIALYGLGDISMYKVLAAKISGHVF